MVADSAAPLSAGPVAAQPLRERRRADPVAPQRSCPPVRDLDADARHPCSRALLVQVGAPA